MKASRAKPCARAIPRIPIEPFVASFNATEPPPIKTKPKVPRSSAKYGVASLFSLYHLLSVRITHCKLNNLNFYEAEMSSQLRV